MAPPAARASLSAVSHTQQRRRRRGQEKRQRNGKREKQWPPWTAEPLCNTHSLYGSTQVKRLRALVSCSGWSTCSAPIVDPEGVGRRRLEAELTHWRGSTADTLEEEGTALHRVLFLSLLKLMHIFQNVYATYAVIFLSFFSQFGGEGGGGWIGGHISHDSTLFFFADPCQPSDLVAVRF